MTNIFNFHQNISMNSLMHICPIISKNFFHVLRIDFFLILNILTTFMRRYDLRIIISKI